MTARPASEKVRVHVTAGRCGLPKADLHRLTAPPRSIWSDDVREHHSLAGYDLPTCCDDRTLVMDVETWRPHLDQPPEGKSEPTRRQEWAVAQRQRRLERPAQSVFDGFSRIVGPPSELHGAVGIRRRGRQSLEDVARRSDGDGQPCCCIQLRTTTFPSQHLTDLRTSWWVRPRPGEHDAAVLVSPERCQRYFCL